jgi:NAD(P)-dependent dehydrogenase (short-subunit alcohol dehydrogenase family)
VVALGRRCLVVATNVSVASEVKRLSDELEAGLVPVGALVHNAVVARLTPLEQFSERDFDETPAVNLKSVFLLTQAMLPGMRARRWGRIITLSSVAVRTRCHRDSAAERRRRRATGLSAVSCRRLLAAGLIAGVVPLTVRAGAVLEEATCTRPQSAWNGTVRGIDCNQPSR